MRVPNPNQNAERPAQLKTPFADWAIEEDLASVPPLTLEDALWLRVFIKAHSAVGLLPKRRWEDEEPARMYGATIAAEFGAYRSAYARAGPLPNVFVLATTHRQEQILSEHLQHRFLKWRAESLHPVMSEPGIGDLRQQTLARRIADLLSAFVLPVIGGEDLVRGVRRAAKRKGVANLLPSDLTSLDVLGVMFAEEGHRLYYTDHDGKSRVNFKHVVDRMRPTKEEMRHRESRRSLDTRVSGDGTATHGDLLAGPSELDPVALAVEAQEFQLSRLDALDTLQRIQDLAELDAREREFISRTLDAVEAQRDGDKWALGGREHARRLKSAGYQISPEGLRKKWKKLLARLRAAG